jgi:hypothetical protein
LSFTDKALKGLRTLGNQAGNLLLEGKIRRRLNARAVQIPEKIDAILYFADDPSSAYQIRQWFAPMKRLAEQHPVVVVVHKATTAAALIDDCPLPIYLASGIEQVEHLVQGHGVRLVFYVNNNQANFTVLRLTEPVHIHLSHGESDKISMASNQLKAYDFAFIAGEASRKRILSHTKRLDPAKLVTIGRPQLDDAKSSPTPNHQGRTTVLYAPTWEGDRAAMAYGSAVSHGPAMVEAILSDPRYRLIFRPHPRTGVRLRSHADAVRRIGSMISKASRASPEAGHCYDRHPDFTAALAEADICICDISAMAMDWLPYSRPLVITQPVEKAATVTQEGITSVVPLLPANDASMVVPLLDQLLEAPISREQQELIQIHFGDTSPGAGTRRFLSAVEKALEQPTA